YTPSGSGATFTVTVNGVTTVNTSVAAPATLGRLIAYGNAGDDDISVVKSGPTLLAVPAYLFGDAGNDNLDAGGRTASNDLVGGAGLDWFFAQLSGSNPDKIKKQDPGEIVTTL